jgi:hypothetical protein
MSTYRPIWYAQADISHEVGFICNSDIDLHQLKLKIDKDQLNLIYLIIQPNIKVDLWKD